MRLCIVNERKALFHCWEQKAEIVPPSPMRDGHSGGIIRYAVAIIEYEDGSVAEIPASEVTFLDTQKVMGKIEKQLLKWKTLEKEIEKENDDLS